MTTTRCGYCSGVLARSFCSIFSLDGLRHAGAGAYVVPDFLIDIKFHYQSFITTPNRTEGVGN